MTADTPIKHYLKNCKPNVTGKDDVNFYLDRLLYYKNLLEMGDEPIEKANGYGEILFEIDRKGMEDMYDFWFNAMIWFVESEKIRDYKTQKSS